jgi:hypothetical protein
MNLTNYFAIETTVKITANINVEWKKLSHIPVLWDSTIIMPQSVLIFSKQFSPISDFLIEIISAFSISPEHVSCPSYLILYFIAR